VNLLQIHHPLLRDEKVEAFYHRNGVLSLRHRIRRRVESVGRKLARRAAG
jgi:hypothetical protein